MSKLNNENNEMIIDLRKKESQKGAKEKIIIPIKKYLPEEILNQKPKKKL